MRIRVADYAALALGVTAGGALPAGALTPDASRLLVTFMGLVAASILPTVTLMVNTVTSNGRSVQGITKLGAEARAAVRALFIVLGLTGLSVVALTLLTTPFPWHLPSWIEANSWRNRIGQAVSLAVICETLNRTRVVPVTIFKCLTLKIELGVDEARQKVADKAPKSGEMAASFKNPAGFGAVRALEDLHNR